MTNWNSNDKEKFKSLITNRKLNKNCNKSLFYKEMRDV